MKRTTEERFLSKFRMPMFEDGCWLWEGTMGDHGYGFLWSGGKNLQVHRWSYGYFVGPIPAGLQLDHLCRNRRCVNPAHLEPVTARENTLRGYGPTSLNAVKTHCKRGHPFDATNTGYEPKGRFCIPCKIILSLRRHANGPRVSRRPYGSEP